MTLPQAPRDAVTPSLFYPLHRPELEADLRAGDRKLASLIEPGARTFTSNRTIIEADVDHGLVYRLRSGWCARARHLRDGRSQIVAVLLPGDLFGVKSMFVDRQTDEVSALDDVIADGIDQARLREAARNDWQVGLRLSWQLVEDDRRLHNWTVSLGRGSADEKLALFLLELRGRLVLGKTIAADALRFDLPMTQNQIGDMLGLTAVHVNRTIKRFREEGLATFGRKLVSLDDPARLYRIALPMLDSYEKRRPEFGSRAA